MRMQAAALASVLALAVGAADAAGPQASGGISRYQTRLEADAYRVLSPEVSGTVKKTLSTQAVDLWASLTVEDWRAKVVRRVPALERAATVLVRRAEVIWAEEAGSEPFRGSIPQQAAVHSLMRGLARLHTQSGEETPRAPPRGGAPSRATAGPGAGAGGGVTGFRAVARPTTAPRATTAPRTAPAPVAATPARAVLSSPAALAAYRSQVEAEAVRILDDEIQSGLQRRLASRRAEMAAAPTVAAWKALLVQCSASLANASRVLERRTEVLREKAGLPDPVDSPAVQRAAVQGLQAGLDRLLRQFGM